MCLPPPPIHRRCRPPCGSGTNNAGAGNDCSVRQLAYCYLSACLRLPGHSRRRNCRAPRAGPQMTRLDTSPRRDAAYSGVPREVAAGSGIAQGAGAGCSPEVHRVGCLPPGAFWEPALGREGVRAAPRSLMEASAATDETAGRSRLAGGLRICGTASPGGGEAVAGAPFRGAGLRVRRGWIPVWSGRRDVNPRPSPWQDAFYSPSECAASRGASQLHPSVSPNIR